MISILFLLTFYTNNQLEPSAKFPAWVRQAVMEAQRETAPEGADLWRLLDETTITLRKDGRQERRRRMVQWVLREGGADRAGYFLIDGDENTTKIKKLKGWHQRASGKFDKLDKDNVVTFGQSDRDIISTDTATLAQFDYLGKGSLVAFESFGIPGILFPHGHPLDKHILPHHAAKNSSHQGRWCRGQGKTLYPTPGV